MLAIALTVSALVLPAAPAAPCTHAQLRLHVGRANGTAGTIYHPLIFTNAGERACTLRGYPGVSSVTGPHGHQIGNAAARDPFAVARVLLRAHGGAATAVYGQVDTGVYDRARCRPLRTRGLRVYAPGDTLAFYAALPHSACSSHLRDSHVRPVVAGRTGHAGGRVRQSPVVVRHTAAFPCRWRFDLEAGLRTGYVTAANSADCSGRQGSLTLSVRLLRWDPASKAWHTVKVQTKTWRHLDGNRYLELAKPCTVSTVRALAVLAAGTSSLASEHMHAQSS